MEKLEFGSCFVCGRIMITSKLSPSLIKEYSDCLMKLFGYWDKMYNKGHKIGNQPICVNCENDFYDILELGKYQIDYSYDG